MSRVRERALFVLVVLGVCIAAYLTWIDLRENGNAFCTGLGNCEKVQQSRYAQVDGIPIAGLGLVMYGALLAILTVRRMQPALAVRQLAGALFFIAFGGTVYSLYLTGLELFVIHAICIWCVSSAVVVTAACTLSAIDLSALQVMSGERAA